MCHVLEVGRSTFYDWLNHSQSERRAEDEILKEKILEIFLKSDRTYGHRRIKKRLRRQRIKCSNSRIRRLMKELRLVPVQTRKFKATTNSKHSLPVAPNLLQQDFTAQAPYEKWVGDITYIPTGEGWLYLATVIDLFSRRVVGWALSERMTKQLVINAINMAIINERPPEGVIFHSDRGSQYASYDFQDMLRENRILQSMSAKGDCYDNACAESFFATIKKELVHRRRFSTRSEATLAILNYIVSWYNPHRIDSALGDLSPMEFEQEYYEMLLVAA